MAWASYNTYTFTNDTGLKANGLHVECPYAVELVSVDGKPPEGLDHGDYGVSGNGKRLDIFALETAPGRTLRVRVKGSTTAIMVDILHCYWMKDGKKLKPLKLTEVLWSTTSAKTSPSRKAK
jgi:hypothetical protein